ncbi:N-6 DNA Methylase, partial [mine drainage metagenome]
RERDYEPIYGHNVSPFFKGPEASVACVGVVKALLDMAPRLELPDLAGQVFQTLIPLNLRKPLGANYTNPRAAALLAALSIARPDLQVLDPACGSGTLLVAAYNRKKALSTGASAHELHKRFLEVELTGIDAMAFAGHLAAVNLALQQPLLETDYLRIGSIDSTTLRDPGNPGSLVPAAGDALPSELVQARLDAEFGSKTKSKRERVISVSRAAPKEFTVGLQDLVMMNPPFTSRDNMSANYRDRLAARFSSGEYGKATEGKKISQQAYFLLLADEFLRPGGEIASVLPLTTLGGKDYWPLVDFLCRHYTVRYVVVGLGRTSFSEDTSLSECLLVAEKTPPDAHAKFRLVGTLLPPDAWDDDLLAQIVKGCSNGESVPGLTTLREFPQAALIPGDQMLPGLMLRLLPEYDLAYSRFVGIRQESAVPFIQGAELRRRGMIYRERVEKARHLTELGASAFLACRQKERALKKIDRLYVESENQELVVFRDRISNATYSFPKSDLVPAIRRFPYLHRLNVSSSSDYCVRSTGPELRHVLEKMYGEKEGIRKFHHLKERKLWPTVVDKNSTRLAIAMRVNFAAPGTTVVSCWSDTPMFVANDYL